MANTVIDYELTYSNNKYIERDTFPHEPHNEFPAVYGNEPFEYELTFEGKLLLANTGGDSVEPFTFDVQTGEPLDPSQTIRIDVSPNAGGGYATSTHDLVAYWDDFNNTDFVNGVANTFSGVAGLYGTITVYDHKIRWENVEWANWTQPFNLGFFVTPSTNFWNTYNAGAQPEQIVVYGAYGVANNEINASYPTTVANTVPYFIPPQANTANYSSGNPYNIPTGAISRVEVLNPYPPQYDSVANTGVVFLKNDHPAALREEVTDGKFVNPATGIDYNQYFNATPKSDWVSVPSTPTFTFVQSDGPRRDPDTNALVTGKDFEGSAYVFRFLSPNGAVHDNGLNYEWYGSRIDIIDGGKNYAIGDTFEMIMDNPDLSLGTDVPLRWIVRDIDAPSANADVNSITMVSSPNPYVDITITSPDKVRFTKNDTRIWPEEEYIFQTYANSVFEASARTTANVTFEEANSFYSNTANADTIILKEWVAPDDERNNRTSVEEYNYVFEMNTGDGVDVPIETQQVTFKQRHYWSTDPGRGIFDNVIEETPQANGAFEDLFAPTISQVQQDYYLFANTYNEIIQNAEDLFGDNE